jgi:hypothetical protein
MGNDYHYGGHDIAFALGVLWRFFFLTTRRRMRKKRLRFNDKKKKDILHFMEVGYPREDYT